MKSERPTCKIENEFRECTSNVPDDIAAKQPILDAIRARKLPTRHRITESGIMVSCVFFRVRFSTYLMTDDGICS